MFMQIFIDMSQIDVALLFPFKPFIISPFQVFFLFGRTLNYNYLLFLNFTLFYDKLLVRLGLMVIEETCDKKRILTTMYLFKTN